MPRPHSCQTWPPLRFTAKIPEILVLFICQLGILSHVSIKVTVFLFSIITVLTFIFVSMSSRILDPSLTAVIFNYFLLRDAVSYYNCRGLFFLYLKRLYKWYYSYTTPVILFPLIKRLKYQLLVRFSDYTKIWYNDLVTSTKRPTIFLQKAKHREAAWEVAREVYRQTVARIILTEQKLLLTLKLKCFCLLCPAFRRQLFKVMRKTKGRLLLLLTRQSHFPTSCRLVLKLAPYTPRLVGDPYSSSCRM